MATKKVKYNQIKIVLMQQDRTSIWLAGQMGVSTAAVSKWCTNENQPTVETLFRIARVLKVTVPELLILEERK